MQEARERDFWDHHVPSLQECVAHYESGPDPNVATMLDAVDPLEGRQVLDFACGPGVTAAWLADRGAVVTAVDLSPVSTARARELWQALGKRATAVTGTLDAVRQPAQFDRIVGRYALHHLDCAEIGPQLAERLRPGGSAAFVETMATNPVLRWSRDNLVGRLGIARLGTTDERPLGAADLAALRRSFARQELVVGQMQLFRILDRQVFRYRSPRMTRLLAAADDLLQRSTRLHRLSYHQVVVLAGPGAAR